MPAAALLRLARRAAAFNACMGLTGRLRLDGRRFVQTVEGPADVVLPLAGAILADPRHGAIWVTRFDAIAVRRFDDWRDEGFAGLAGTAAGVKSPRHAGADRAAARGVGGDPRHRRGGSALAAYRRLTIRRARRL